MDNINVCVFLASSVDKKDSTINNIINELVYNEEGNSMDVVTVINGKNVANEKLELDYFIRVVSSGDENSNYKKKYSYLFSTETSKGESGENEEGSEKKQMKASYSDWFFALASENIQISFPCKGDYELEVFEITNKEEDSATERYKEYRDNNVEPKALYCFKVK